MSNFNSNDRAAEMPVFPAALRGLLALCGAYQLLWGIFIRWFPDAFLHWVNVAGAVSEKEIKIMGFILMLIGMGLIWAAFKPMRLKWFVPGLVIVLLLSQLWLIFMASGQTIPKKLLFYAVITNGAWILLCSYVIYRIFQFDPIYRKYLSQVDKERADSGGSV